MLSKLQTLELDVERGILRVNGIDFSNVDRFSLLFENGAFVLSVSQGYSADGKKISRSGNETADE